MADVPRLPVFATIDRAFFSSVIHFGYFLRLIWGWVVVTIIAHAAVNLAIIWALPARDQAELRQYLSFFAEFAVLMPAIASIAVAWHRFMIEGRRVSALVYLEVSPAIWRYASIAFLFVATALTPLILASFIQHWKTRDAFTTTALATAVLLFLVAQIINARLSLWLPAVALERKGADATWAWHVARKNTWRLCLGCLACWLPPVMIVSLLPAWPTSEMVDPLSALIEAIKAVLQATLLPLPTLSFLSLAYQQLLLGQEEALRT